MFQQEACRPEPERDAMTTVGTVIGHLLLVGPPRGGEAPNVAAGTLRANDI